MFQKGEGVTSRHVCYRKFCDEVHGVLIGVLPVLRLLESLLVRLHKLAFGVHGAHCRRKLGHRVNVTGKAVQEVYHVLWYLGAVCPFFGNGFHLQD